MGYPDDHGRSGGPTTETYDLNVDSTPPYAYEPVYDAEGGHSTADMPQPGPQPGSQPGPQPGLQVGPQPATQTAGHRAAGPQRRSLPLLLGGGLVALVVSIGAGVGLSKLLGSDNGGATNAGATGAATAAPKASQPSPTVSGLPTGPLGAMLKSRSTDPQPLTLREIFRRKAFTIGGIRYVMTTWRATRACGKTAHGAKLVSALHKGGCDQVLRGTFARADGKLVGTVGIANMRTARAATATAKIANSAKDAYVVPLPGRGTTKNLGKGIAYASAEARGHYVLLSWIQAPNGKTIPRGVRKAATVFEPNVIYGSKLGFALQYRGIAGKPYGR